MKCVRKLFCREKSRKRLGIAIVSFSVMLSNSAYAQNGNDGIDQATDMVKSYFDSGANLMYAVGALLGLIGGVKVYQKWNHGDHDTGKVARLQPTRMSAILAHSGWFRNELRGQ